MEIKEKKPKVSVCVVTYNHEEYIRQCLQSIIDQETNFDFEIIVGDDCSTDGTRAIVKDFFDKYPEIIKPLFHQVNLGPTRNYFAVHGKASGEYIAHCDGDDYWLPNKLNFQVGLLRDRPELFFVADYIGKKSLAKNEVVKLGFSELFCENNPVLHSSKIYRRNSLLQSYENREYYDFEISLRQLSDCHYCGLTENRTAIHRVSKSSIRRSVNVNLLMPYMAILKYATLIGLAQREVARIYDTQVRSLVKLSIVTDDASGAREISNLANGSDFALNLLTRMYLRLAQISFMRRLLKSLLVAKRCIIKIMSLR